MQYTRYVGAANLETLVDSLQQLHTHMLNNGSSDEKTFVLGITLLGTATMAYHVIRNTSNYYAIKTEK
jgi:hypothetical protein|tara:strand:+ start:1482 stop:1685 length:204 start_codon:yes stop_codon:yes gene_type:complete